MTCWNLQFVGPPLPDVLEISTIERWEAGTLVKKVLANDKMSCSRPESCTNSRHKWEAKCLLFSAAGDVVLCTAWAVVPGDTCSRCSAAGCGSCYLQLFSPDLIADIALPPTAELLNLGVLITIHQGYPRLSYSIDMKNPPVVKRFENWTAMILLAEHRFGSILVD